jgi:multidrug efflux pump subunit AcrA (membrane-fusion protein)
MKRGMRKVAHKKAFKSVSKVVGSVAKSVSKAVSFIDDFIPGANILSAISIGAQLYSGMQQRKYANQAADAAQRQYDVSKEKAAQESRYQEVLAQRQRTQTLREGFIRKGNIVAQTGGAGLGMAGTSSFTGAVGSLGTQVATGIGNINVAETTGQTLSDLNVKIGGAASDVFQAQSKEQGWQQIGSLAGQIPSIGNIFKIPETTTKA